MRSGGCVFRRYKLDTLSHIINLSRGFLDAHIDLSRMFLRDTVGNAKSHSLELIVSVLVRFGRKDKHKTLQASFGRKKTM